MGISFVVMGGDSSVTRHKFDPNIKRANDVNVDKNVHKDKAICLQKHRFTCQDRLC